MNPQTAINTHLLFEDVEVGLDADSPKTKRKDEDMVENFFHKITPLQINRVLSMGEAQIIRIKVCNQLFGQLLTFLVRFEVMAED